MFNMKLKLFVFALLPLAVVSLPYPPPEPERIFPCSGPYDNSCGKEGICQFNKNKIVLKDLTAALKKSVVVNDAINSTYVCECSDKYGSLSVDHEPCARERVSKVLVFWMQIIFGWIGVGAFILHWWWYASSIFVAIGIGMLCICGTCLCKEKDDDDEISYLECMSSYVSCMLLNVIIAMWITNFVFIITDCYSVVNLDGKEYAFKCWENL